MKVAMSNKISCRNSLINKDIVQIKVDEMIQIPHRTKDIQIDGKHVPHTNNIGASDKEMTYKFHQFIMEGGIHYDTCPTSKIGFH